MTRRHQRAIAIVSTSLFRSLPIRTMSALSRATSVPEPIATPTLAAVRAGASLMPSPTIATVRPPASRVRTCSALSDGSTSARTSSTPTCRATDRAIGQASPVSSTVRTPIRRMDATASIASGRRPSLISSRPRSRPWRAT